MDDDDSKCDLESRDGKFDDYYEQELEEQLEIFPEKKGIKKFGSVLHCVQQVSNFVLDTDLQEKIQILTRDLEPVQSFPGKAILLPTSISDRILTKLARSP